MLIPFGECVKIMRDNGLSVNGVLHIGAHHCEEMYDYTNNGVDSNKIDWIEANPKLVDFNRSRGISCIHCLAVDDEEGEADFNVTNNGQSSSLLQLGTHKESYPHIYVSEVIKVQKKKLTTFFGEHPEIDISQRNFWNLDIQGSELNALKSAGDDLNHVVAIYSEVNTKKVYEKCGLLEEMDDFLGNKGFKRVAISMTGAHWGDALWLRV